MASGEVDDSDSSSSSDIFTYIPPRRLVAICYQPFQLTTDSSPPLLGAGCSQLAHVGSSGGLVVLEPAAPAAAEAAGTSSSTGALSYLCALLGIPDAASDSQSALIPASPAAAYPPRYGSLAVQLLTSSHSAHLHVDSVRHERQQTGRGSHLCPPRLIPSQLLQSPSASSLLELITTTLDQWTAQGSGAPNSLILHLTADSLHSAPGDDSQQLLPPVLDSLVLLLQQLVSASSPPAASSPSPYADVYLSVLRLQPQLHRSPLAWTPLASFLPSQSFQLAIPSLSSAAAAFLPLISYHHNTTRSDCALHTDRSAPAAFAVGSLSLLAARDWLSELAFRLGGKAKYGA